MAPDFIERWKASA